MRVKRAVLDVEPSSYATFNRFDHELVDIPAEGLTISCRTPRGKLVTFSFLPSYDLKNDDMECVDIKYHNSPKTMTTKEAKPRKMSIFHMLGFTVGHEVFDTRNGEMPTLATLLLSKDHYK